MKRICKRLVLFIPHVLIGRSQQRLSRHKLNSGRTKLASIIAACALVTPTAFASNACYVLDHASHIAGLARTVQAEGGPSIGSRALTNLTELVKNTELSGIGDLVPATALASHYNQVISFRSNITAAIDLVEAGQFETAGYIFSSIDVSTVGASIVALRNYNSCSSVSLIAASQDLYDTNESPVDRRSIEMAVDTSVLERKASTLDQNAASETRSNTRNDQAEEIETTKSIGVVGSSILAVLLLLFLVGIALVSWWSRRARKYKKRANRYTLSFPIRIRQKGEGRAAKLIEISETGCKIQHKLGNIDKRISLRLLGKLRKARIVWANDRYAGIKFNKPIEFEFLNEIVRAARKPV